MQSPAIHSKDACSICGMDPSKQPARVDAVMEYHVLSSETLAVRYKTRQAANKICVVYSLRM